jgi:signal transduction histidine kinase
MASPVSRRLVLLFLLAIVFPCCLLIFLGLRTLRAERELAEKRWPEEQRHAAREIRRELLDRLERIKVMEAEARAAPGHQHTTIHGDPAVVLAGAVRQNRLILPWESASPASGMRKLLADTRYAEKISQGERAEFAGNDLAKAAGFYQAGIESARYPAQAEYARLYLARIHAKRGADDEALNLLHRTLMLPREITDEHGIPLCFYAAVRLLENGREQQAVLERLRLEAKSLWDLPPEAAYMLRSAADVLSRTAAEGPLRDSARDLGESLQAYIGEMEQALALQAEFPNLRPTPAEGASAVDSVPRWTPYGGEKEERWLLGVAAPSNDSPELLIAVRAKPVFSSLEAGGIAFENIPVKFRILATGTSEGEALGPDLPGIRVAFDPQGESALVKRWRLQLAFLWASLSFILVVTLFGGFLLWRDVRRELTLAEMRSQFVASVSHELKTPLTAIRMFAETLRMGRLPDSRVQDEYLDTIVAESERLSRLLDNVLDFSKIEAGQKVYRTEPTLLSGVVRAAARTMQYPLARAGFQLHLHVEDGLPEVAGDRDALEQGVLNLLTNAMKYSGESREIDLRLRRQDQQAVIEVTDRGVGITTGHVKRIFEKFYRVPTPENQRIPGTGLGLTLVEHVAKAHGGFVEVASTPGKGSTFAIHLPLRVNS